MEVPPSSIPKPPDNAPSFGRILGNKHPHTLLEALASLRDTQLPKLVSGEVRLPAALVERYGEAATTTAA